MYANRVTCKTSDDFEVLPWSVIVLQILARIDIIQVMFVQKRPNYDKIVGCDALQYLCSNPIEHIAES